MGYLEEQRMHTKELTDNLREAVIKGEQYHSRNIQLQDQIDIIKDKFFMAKVWAWAFGIIALISLYYQIWSS